MEGKSREEKANQAASAAGGGDGAKNGKAKEEKKEDKKGGGGGKGAKVATAVVLKAAVHCQGCALKIKKTLNGVEGVELVAADPVTNTVTVTGTADPWEIKEKIEARTRKPVAFLMPANPPSPPKRNQKDDTAAAGSGDGEDKSAAANGGKDKKSGEDKNTKEKNDKAKKDGGGEKERPETTVVLKTELHCGGCIDRMKKTLQKIKGLKQVTVDAAKDLVTVTGTMDAKELVEVIKTKLMRSAEVVPAKKESTNTAGAAGEKKKENEKEKEKEKEKGKKKADDGGAAGGKKDVDRNISVPPAVMESWIEEPRPGVYLSELQYRIDVLQSSQLFSDENPNACAVM